MTGAVVNPGSSEQRTSPSLLERVRSQNQEAWAQLVRLYGPMVYGWCLRAGLQPADAADVGQEVFASVARAIGSFRRDYEGASFRGWLFTITRNKLRDRYAPPGTVGAGGSDAQRRLAEMEADEESGSGPAGAGADDQTRGLYRRAVECVRAEFESRTWEAFWRFLVDEQPAADVAASLGMTVNAVYLAKSRVLRRLREEFASMIDFDAPQEPTREG